MTRIHPLRSNPASSTPGQHSSTVSILCRICYDGDRPEDLITPCDCKGTVAFVHRSCLETWLGESNTTTCELCHHVFKTERRPKFTSGQSIWRWCWYSPSSCTKGVKSDILACTIITPLAIVITYICLFSSEYYSQKKFINIPAARWTSASLFVMIVIMLIGYYLWTYSIIRIHARLWYSWWQRTCDVRYISPSTINIPTNDGAQIQFGTTSRAVQSSVIVPAQSDDESISSVRIEAKANTNGDNFPKQKQDGKNNVEITQTESQGHFSECTIVSYEFNDNIVPK